MSRQRQPRLTYKPPKSREQAPAQQGQRMMGDMILTSDQMNFLTARPSLSRTFNTKWLWTEKQNWDAAQKKYIIPYTDHPVKEAQESFYFNVTTIAESQ